MNSREDILSRVRARIGRATGNAAVATEAAERWLAARQQGPRPAVGGGLLASFREKSEALVTTVGVLADASAAPAGGARYLAPRALR